MRLTRPILVLICLSVFAVVLAQSPPAYSISGDVRDQTGQFFSGATVCAIPAERGIVRVRDKVCTESDGQAKFSVKLPQPGRYQVIAEKTSDGYMPSYIPFFKNPQTPIPEIVIDNGSRNASVSVTLGPKSGLITGKVIDEAADTPIQDFVVWVWQERNPNARYHEIVKGNHASGRFKLFAPPMPFRLRVEAEGYEDWIMGGGLLISAAGPRKGPGSLLVRTGTTADFAVYLKRKNQTATEPSKVINEPRLPAPIQLSPIDSAVFDLFPRTTKLEWNPVDGALSYAFEVESCWNPSSDPRSKLPYGDGECINPSPYLEQVGVFDTTFEFFFKGAQPGRWRVWAIDRGHKPGLKSPWRGFIHLK